MTTQSQSRGQYCRESHYKYGEKWALPQTTKPFSQAWRPINGEIYKAPIFTIFVTAVTKIVKMSGMVVFSGIPDSDEFHEAKALAILSH
jgi:hypothetical protein